MFFLFSLFNFHFFLSLWMTTMTKTTISWLSRVFYPAGNSSLGARRKLNSTKLFIQSSNPFSKLSHFVFCQFSTWSRSPFYFRNYHVFFLTSSLIIFLLPILWVLLFKGGFLAICCVELHQSSDPAFKRFYIQNNPKIKIVCLLLFKTDSLSPCNNEHSPQVSQITRKTR